MFCVYVHVYIVCIWSKDRLTDFDKNRPIKFLEKSNPCIFGSSSLLELLQGNALYACMYGCQEIHTHPSLYTCVCMYDDTPSKPWKPCISDSSLFLQVPEYNNIWPYMWMYAPEGQEGYTNATWRRRNAPQIEKVHAYMHSIAKSWGYVACRRSERMAGWYISFECSIMWRGFNARALQLPLKLPVHVCVCEGCDDMRTQQKHTTLVCYHAMIRRNGHASPAFVGKGLSLFSVEISRIIYFFARYMFQQRLSLRRATTENVCHTS